MKGALRLAAVDQQARSLGLEPGMTLADARARVPGLHAAEHDPAADHAWLGRLAGGSIRYTPMLGLD
ncbi:MAG: DNA polymerase Y family protein, partial [Sphingomonas sp.]|nr:DNA polymerase Y family protein [Sphingomonas sp.]